MKYFLIRIQLKPMGGAFLSQPVTTKKTQKYQHRKVRVICSEMQGWRKYMQDASLFDRISKETFLFGVFDGHGGCEVAHFVSKRFSTMLQNTTAFKNQKYEQALDETFKIMDELLFTEDAEKQLKQISRSNGLQPFEDGRVADSVGCTANVVLLVGNMIYVANAGDSRAALSRDGNVVVLSTDHKPENQQQKKRIYDAGAKIEKGRINGHLNLSRSLGDLHYKRGQNLTYDKHPITCKPEIKVLELCKQDEFLIMGCDGVWERYETDSKGLLDLIRDGRLNGKAPEDVLEGILDELLAKDTNSQLGCDNMSAILIQFNKLML